MSESRFFRMSYLLLTPYCWQYEKTLINDPTLSLLIGSVVTGRDGLDFVVGFNFSNCGRTEK